MITAVHTLIYSDDPEATRRFLTEVLAWPSVDVGGGWLIYSTGPSELGIHPTSSEHGGQTYSHHQLALLCDDIHGTVAELSARGATFTREVRDDGWGLTIDLAMPGADDILVYQPLRPSPALDAARPAG